MEKTSKKLKMLYLAKIFMEKTDDEHALTLPQIQAELEKYGIGADRKILYDDFELLRDFGIDIVRYQKANQFFYHVGNRRFELPELKLLVDSVQAAKFITERKSRELIKKLESLVSTYEAQQLHRQVMINGRVKSMNESVYYNVDKIHAAIGADRQIRFNYFNWTPDKKVELRHNGEYYQVSPWGLTWDDENYYLVAYDACSSSVRHYRVDKMLKISMTDDKREGRQEFKSFDISVYSKQVFGMFAGDVTRVTMECTNDLAGVMIDRFGKEVMMHRTDEGHFLIAVDVALSDQFLGWVISLGDGVRITEPQKAVEQIKAIGERICRQYS